MLYWKQEGGNRMPGRLVLVGTPIGNLSDFSPRARQALEECDLIAAEDTRVTLKLLNHFDIKKPSSAITSTTAGKKANLSARGFWRGKPSAWSPTRGCPPSPTQEKTWWLCVPNGKSRWRRYRGPARW